MKQLKKDKIENYLTSLNECEKDYVGIDAQDSEETDENIEVPYNISDVRVEQKMITIYQIEDWIEGGMLNLRPEYQRNLVWDTQEKSALIESILLRMPLPPVWLDEDEKGYKNVIDGMQRLNTIHEFIQNEFCLKKLQYFSKCENLFFRELPAIYQSYILRTVLAVNILDARCPQMVKFDIFRRINTCGLQLNPQEIRNAKASPMVRNLLKDMSSCEEFKMATGGGVNDIRLGAQELCLRFLTILRHYDWENRRLVEYHGLMKTMDDMVIKLNMYINSRGYDAILNDFKMALHQSHMILGCDFFSKPGRGKKRVNASLFTSWTVVLVGLHLSNAYIERNAARIYDSYRKELEGKNEFYHAVTFSTGSRKNIEFALEYIRSLLEEEL